MKTKMTRMVGGSLAVAGLVLCTACAEDKVAGTVPVMQNQAAMAKVPAPSSESEISSTTEQNLPPYVADTEPLIEIDEAPSTNLEKRVIQPAVLPDNLDLSPDLAEFVKLVQSGVSDEVLKAYVANSSRKFQVGSDEIVYLKDLGLSSELITVVIEQDTAPRNSDQPAAAQAIEEMQPAQWTDPDPVSDQLQTVAVDAPAATREAPAYAGDNTAPAPDTSAPAAPVNVSTFYDSLAPYGNWVEVPEYGVVWQPTVAVVNTYWRPYADHGRWIWSDAGWYWYSYYSWGWAPFHYGRWSCPSGIGWVWVPDTYWGPSWVTWRYNSYYCGWAPLPPRSSYVSGFGLYYGGGSVGLGFGFGFGSSYYTFVHWNRFCDRYPHHYYASRSHARSIYHDSTPITKYGVGRNRTPFNEGVGIERAARMSRAEIRQVAVREGGPGSRGVGRAERLVNDGANPVVYRPSLRPPTEKGAGRMEAASASRSGRSVENTGVSRTPQRTDRGLANSDLESRGGDARARTDQPQKTMSPRGSESIQARGLDSPSRQPAARSAGGRIETASAPEGRSSANATVGRTSPSTESAPSQKQFTRAGSTLANAPSVRSESPTGTRNNSSPPVYRGTTPSPSRSVFQPPQTTSVESAPASRQTAPASSSRSAPAASPSSSNAGKSSTIIVRSRPSAVPSPPQYRTPIPRSYASPSPRSSSSLSSAPGTRPPASSSDSRSGNPFSFRSYSQPRTTVPGYSSRSTFSVPSRSSAPRSVAPPSSSFRVPAARSPSRSSVFTPSRSAAPAMRSPAPTRSAPMTRSAPAPSARPRTAPAPSRGSFGSGRGR